jgi:DNA phosphorothioation system restriction enzyme
MPLKNTVQSGVYDSSTTILNDDVLELCLEQSIIYDRGVGFFSSGWLKDAARGMKKFAEKGGRARWIASPKLEKSDWDALLRGLNARNDDILKNAILKNISDLQVSMEKDTLNALAWLIADDVIDFRLALPKAQLAGGDFHDKFGTFVDENGDVVSFNGSYNDSIQGNRNFESISVFCEWDLGPLKEMSKMTHKKFNRIWDNTDPNVEIYTLPAAAKAKILELRQDRPYKPPIRKIDKAAIKALKIPDWLRLREYQKEAINAWSTNNKNGITCGILAMATGTGKTLTALATAALLSSKNSTAKMATIVMCPYLNLCQQWEKDIREFGLEPVSCYDGYSNWATELDNAYSNLSLGLTKDIVIVVSNSTFITHSFQKRLKLATESNDYTHFLIADEMHNLGSEKMQSLLPSSIKVRLGLSATPERHGDEDGTKALFDYFGEIVFEFSLKKAIDENFLTPYEYHPIVVELTNEESKYYIELTTQIGKALAGAKDSISDNAKYLLFRRARLVGAAKNKLVELDKLIGTMEKKPKKALFYCGDGRISDDPEDLTISTRQIESVCSILGINHNMRIAPFTYEETKDQREQILSMMRSNDLDGIVAIRCLDEGIDLPALDCGFILASSSNPRQFIQRRGRLLRKSEGKTMAVIYDFVVAPPQSDSNEQYFNIERRMFRSELKRIDEFCQTAINQFKASEVIRDLRIRYNLLGNL